jgi:coproporphyrinogen III oxidase-like Fe-S oxidoreductase
VETWWLGLRLHEGVDPEEARATSGCPARSDPTPHLVEELLGQGWLVERRGRIALSERGVPLGDAIAARFLALGEGAGSGSARPAPPVPTRLEPLVGGGSRP